VPGDREPERFACHRCGTCCTSLDAAWDAVDGARAVGEGGLYRLPSPGGLRMFAWRADRFPRGRLDPLLVAADADRERLVALAYELTASTCPNHDPDEGCTVYEDRPLVCRAFPLVAGPGDEGIDVEASALCPGRVELTEAASEGPSPERALARLYPEELPAALAVPAMVPVLEGLVDLLGRAGALTPAEDLDAGTVERWAKREPVDLVALAREAGVADRAGLVERAERVRERLRDRFAPHA
jgi:Fe-S-cluster containining protein